MNLERKKGKLDTMVNEWLSGLTCSDASKGTYLRTLRVWNNWMWMNKHNNVMGATRADVLDFRSFLIDSKKSPHTVCSYLSIVRMFHKFLYLRGERSNIASDVRGVKRNKYYNKRPLTDAQVVGLFGCVDVSTAIGRRDYMILMLMVRAGLRCCEVIRLDVGDRISISGTASLKLQRKGHLDKDQSIPIADDVRDAISDYLKIRGRTKKSDPLAISYRRGLHGAIVRLSVQDVERIAEKHMKAAGVTGEGISPHSLRHTFGCQLVSAGVPINQVQSLMGHNSIDATMIYVKMAADRELFAENPANRVKLL